MQQKTIYDLGANNGSNIPYYLKKADLVVAVEANPVLSREIETQFCDEIRAGRLVIESCVLTAGDLPEEVTFYLHRTNHVLSQFPRPDESELPQFDEITLRAYSIRQLISKWGAPHYVKIDLEHYDTEILKSMFSHGIFPPFISAEVHSIKPFCAMVANGGYDNFKLVDGRSVSEIFKDHEIQTQNGSETYSFPFHSAGPFGEDVPGGWMTADNFFDVLTGSGLGWKDIHATNVPKG